MVFWIDDRLDMTEQKHKGSSDETLMLFDSVESNDIFGNTV